MDMISAEEARALTSASKSNREHAEPDTLSENAMLWALHNAEGRTHTRIRLYAKYGRSSLSVKFAPGTKDGRGSGNSFYSDLAANSNTDVADAMCDIIYSRDQSLISPFRPLVCSTPTTRASPSSFATSRGSAMVCAPGRTSTEAPILTTAPSS